MHLTREETQNNKLFWPAVWSTYTALFVSCDSVALSQRRDS